MRTQIDRQMYRGNIYYIVWVFDSNDNIIGFQKFYDYLDAFEFSEYMIYEKFKIIQGKEKRK